ncbi:MAG: NYN domain-containing protein, partial [Planctomycetes bacterium]|nr:NYN domain-containing protein [Planctomycetota bacterium]
MTGFNDEHQLAVFIDLENIAIGVKDAKLQQMEVSKLFARLVEKGKIAVKKAYADWSAYSQYKRPFHEAAVELVDIPKKSIGGKNSADIKMVVDALELSFTKAHLDIFVLVSGDSDFSPLVSKLRENNKHIIGVGVKNSSSDLLIDNCDEFIYYEDLVRSRPREAKKKERGLGIPKEKLDAFSLMIDSILALQRENKEI